MPRIRSVKPELPLCTELGKCSDQAAFLFVMLPCFADREGRLEDEPGKLKAQIFPYRDADVDALLDELANAKDRKGVSLIERYESGGEFYIQIVKFVKHQQPHIKESASVIPAPDKHGASTVPTPEEPPCPLSSVSCSLSSVPGVFDVAEPPDPPELSVVECEVVEAELVDEPSVPIFPVVPEDPWWDGDEVDPLVREAVLAVIQVSRFAKTEPNRSRFEKLIADQRARAPDDEAIRYEFEGFTAYYLNSKKHTDGIATMRNWFGTKHDRWAAMKRNQPKSQMDRFKTMMGG